MSEHTKGKKCLFLLGQKKRKGIIINAYEELGGAKDGQLYIVVKDIKSGKVQHIKDSNIINMEK